MKPPLPGIVQKLLLFTIACAPLFSLREFLKFSGIAVPGYAIFFNVAKDGLLLLIAVLAAISLVSGNAYPPRVKPFFIGFAGFTALVVLLSLNDTIMILAGIRWALPLFFIFLLAGRLSDGFMRQLTHIVIGLLLLATGLQLYQLFTGRLMWGYTYRGLFGRVTGFYELPGTAGYMSCISFYLVRYFFRGPLLYKRILLFISVFSTLLLSISTTGFIIILGLLLFPLLYRPGRYRVLYSVAGLVLVVVLYFRLDLINGRNPGDAAVSFAIRQDLFRQQLAGAQVVSTHFGQATNAVFILKNLLKQPVSNTLPGGGESFYPTIIGNYGLLFFILFCIVLLWLLYKAIRNHSEQAILFIWLFAAGAATVRLTEIFPVGMLLAIIGAYHLQKRVADIPYQDKYALKIPPAAPS